LNYPTIREVAEAANVSANTVSKALRKRPGVNAETREKIEKIAREIGYEPNILASHLRTQKNRIIGVIITDNSNPFYAEILRGIETQSKEKGYQILIYNTDHDYKKEEQAIKLMFSYQVSGIIMDPIPSKNEHNLDLLQKRKLPYVLINRHFKHIFSNWVGFDDFQVGKTLADLLISKGHKQILFFGGEPGDPAYDDRFAGFSASMQNHGLTVVPELVANFLAMRYLSYQQMKNLLEEGLKFTAVLAFNDLAALDAMRALREYSFKIPEDVALTGVDDLYLSDLVEPGLTTMRLPKEETGRVAVDLLVDCIEKNVTERGVMLNPKLIIRHSV
jgi:LacI family transcriptional regulator